MVINSTGTNGDTRVGIGTTTPTEKLTVRGSILLYGRNNADGGLIFERDAGTLDDPAVHRRFMVDTIFAGGDFFNFRYVAATNVGNASGPNYGGSSVNIMTLAQGGNVGIGTSTPTAKLEVIGGQLKATNGNVGHGTAKFLVSGGPAVINSYCYANAFVTTSDDRIKENEKLIINATETLLKLTPQIYDKYDDMDLSGNPRVESGLIAQEVYYNAPELRHLVEVGLTTDASGNEITPTPDEMDLSGVDIGSDPDYGSHGWGKNHPASLDYNGLIPYMIKSNQEQQTTIEQLEARLAALENK